MENIEIHNFFIFRTIKQTKVEKNAPLLFQDCLKDSKTVFVYVLAWKLTHFYYFVFQKMNLFFSKEPISYLFKYFLRHCFEWKCTWNIIIYMFYIRLID